MYVTISFWWIILELFFELHPNKSQFMVQILAGFILCGEPHFTVCDDLLLIYKNLPDVTGNLTTSKWFSCIDNMIKSSGV